MPGVAIIAELAFSRASLGVALAPHMREFPILYSGASARDAARLIGHSTSVVALVDADPPPREGIVPAIETLARFGFTVTALVELATAHTDSLLREAGASAVLAKSEIGLEDVARAVTGCDTRLEVRGNTQVSIPLTQIQRTVLAKFATGSSCNEIAVEMGVTPATVKTHLKRVRIKYRNQGIDLPARSDIYRAARMSGLIS